jgi:3-oxoacyl-[acyl-carrier protein] reductase
MIESMDLGLAGKTALVTAASEGLGFACAARLVKAGCAVAICGRRAGKLSAARERLKQDAVHDVLALQADIADLKSVEQLVAQVLQHFGRLDILVVNSGHVAYGNLEELTEQQWYDAFELLLMSAVRLARLVIPTMRANKGGDIVFLGSSTQREPPPHLLLSTALRLGVVGLTRIWRAPWRPTTSGSISLRRAILIPAASTRASARSCRWKVFRTARPLCVLLAIFPPAASAPPRNSRSW